MMHEDSVDLYGDLLEDTILATDKKKCETFPELATNSHQNEAVSTKSDPSEAITNSKPSATAQTLSSQSNGCSDKPAAPKLSFQSILKALVEKDNASADTESEDLPAEQREEEVREDDLMNDVYSLHTARDIEHRKELRLKQDEIDRLNIVNDQLTVQNNQLRHNIALLLATAKKELEGQKGMIFALRKQLVVAETLRHSYRPNTRSSTPYTQSSTTCTQSSMPYTQSSMPYTQSSMPYTQSSTPCTQSSMPYTQSSTPCTQSSMPYTQSSMAYAQSSTPCTQSSMPYTQSSMPYTQSSTSYMQSSTSLTHIPKKLPTKDRSMEAKRADKEDPFRKPKSKSKSPHRYHKDDSSSYHSWRRRRSVTPSLGSPKRSTYRMPSCARESSDVRGRMTSRSRVDKAKENLRQRQQSVVKSIDKDYLAKFGRERYERHIQRTMSGSKDVTLSEKTNQREEKVAVFSEPMLRKRGCESSVIAADRKRRKVYKSSPRKSSKKYKPKHRKSHSKHKSKKVSSSDSISELLRLKESLLNALGDDSNISSIADSENIVADVNADPNDGSTEGADTQDYTPPPGSSNQCNETDDNQTKLPDIPNDCSKGSDIPDDFSKGSDIPDDFSKGSENISVKPDNEIDSRTSGDVNTYKDDKTLANAGYGDDTLSGGLSSEVKSKVGCVETAHQGDGQVMSSDSYSVNSTTKESQVQGDGVPTIPDIIQEPHISAIKGKLASLPHKELGAGDQITMSTSATPKPLAAMESINPKADLGKATTSIPSVDVTTGSVKSKTTTADPKCFSSDKPGDLVQTTAADTERVSAEPSHKEKDTTCKLTLNKAVSKKPLSAKTSNARKKSATVEIPLEGAHAVDPRNRAGSSGCDAIELMSVCWTPSSLSSQTKQETGNADSKSSCEKLIISQLSVESTTDSKKLTVTNKVSNIDGTSGRENSACDERLDVNAASKNPVSCSDSVPSSNFKDQTVSDASKTTLSENNTRDSTEKQSLQTVTPETMDKVVNDVTSPLTETVPTNPSDSFTSVLDICQGAPNKKFRIPKKKAPEAIPIELKPVPAKTETVNPYDVAPNRSKKSSSRDKVDSSADEYSTDSSRSRDPARRKSVSRQNNSKPEESLPEKFVGLIKSDAGDTDSSCSTVLSRTNSQDSVCEDTVVRSSSEAVNSAHCEMSPTKPSSDAANSTACDKYPTDSAKSHSLSQKETNTTDTKNELSLLLHLEGDKTSEAFCDKISGTDRSNKNLNECTIVEPAEIREVGGSQDEMSTQECRNPSAEKRPTKDSSSCRDIANVDSKSGDGKFADEKSTDERSAGGRSTSVRSAGGRSADGKRSDRLTDRKYEEKSKYASSRSTDKSLNRRHSSERDFPKKSSDRRQSIDKSSSGSRNSTHGSSTERMSAERRLEYRRSLDRTPHFSRSNWKSGQLESSDKRSTDTRRLSNSHRRSNVEPERRDKQESHLNKPTTQNYNSKSRSDSGSSAHRYRRLSDSLSSRDNEDHRKQSDDSHSRHSHQRNEKDDFELGRDPLRRSTDRSTDERITRRAAEVTTKRKAGESRSREQKYNSKSSDRHRSDRRADGRHTGGDGEGRLKRSRTMSCHDELVRDQRSRTKSGSGRPTTPDVQMLEDKTVKGDETLDTKALDSTASVGHSTDVSSSNQPERGEPVVQAPVDVTLEEGELASSDEGEAELPPDNTSKRSRSQSKSHQKCSSKERTSKFDKRSSRSRRSRCDSRGTRLRRKN